MIGLMKGRASRSVLCSAFASFLALSSTFALQDPASRHLPPAYVQTDAEIESVVVKGILANPEVFAAGMRVRVFHHVVTLAGFVQTRDAKEMAGKVARAVPGVREVKNQLSVRSSKSRNGDRR